MTGGPLAWCCINANHYNAQAQGTGWLHIIIVVKLVNYQLYWPFVTCEWAVRWAADDWRGRECWRAEGWRVNECAVRATACYRLLQAATQSTKSVQEFSTQQQQRRDSMHHRGKAGKAVFLWLWSYARVCRLASNNANCEKSAKTENLKLPTAFIRLLLC